MELSSLQAKRHRRCMQRVLKEIVSLRERISRLPQPFSYEHHADLHQRMDRLIAEYMRLQILARARAGRTSLS